VGTRKAYLSRLIHRQDSLSGSRYTLWTYARWTSVNRKFDKPSEVSAEPISDVSLGHLSIDELWDSRERSVVPPPAIGAHSGCAMVYCAAVFGKRSSSPVTNVTDALPPSAEYSTQLVADPTRLPSFLDSRIADPLTGSTQ